MEQEKQIKWVDARSWDEFRKTGLFMFVNTLLHAFGWALVVEVDNYKELGDDAPVTKCYPARVKYRGFDHEDQSQMHKRIGEYLKNNSEDLHQDTLL
jgi:hypothetical protein